MPPRRRLQVAAAGQWGVRLLAIACLLGALAAGQRAAAHARLVAAEPAAGAVVAEMPPTVALRFDEPVAALVVRWLSPEGEPVDVAATVEGETLIVPGPAGLGDGTHVVSWRVVSSDGHPIGGSHVFSVGAPSAAPDLEAPATTAVPAAVARGLLTLALVVGVGGAVFVRLVARGVHVGTAARLARAGALLVPVAALAALGLHGLDMLGAPRAALAGWAPWAAALGSPLALTAGIAAASGLIAAAALGREGPAGVVLAVAAWAGAALSFATSGHAATASPMWLTTPSVAVHAGAFLFWLGALPGVAVLARGGGAGLVPLLRRFSRLATPLVALLVLSGVALAVVQLGGVALRIDTGYGRLLALKLVSVALLLALAALNRYRLAPAIAAGRAGAPARLRRSVLAEIGLGVVILALAAGFRVTPPPRAMAVPGLHAHLHGPQATADVTLRPGRAGPNRAEIVLVDAQSVPMAPLEVVLAFADPARGIERIVAEATTDGERWRAGPVQLPGAGDWVLRLEVLVSDFDRVTLEGRITLPD